MDSEQDETDSAALATTLQLPEGVELKGRGKDWDVNLPGGLTLTGDAGKAAASLFLRAMDPADNRWEHGDIKEFATIAETAQQLSNAALLDRTEKIQKVLDKSKGLNALWAGGAALSWSGAALAWTLPVLKGLGLTAAAAMGEPISCTLCIAGVAGLVVSTIKAFRASGHMKTLAGAYRYPTKAGRKVLKTQQDILRAELARRGPKMAPS